MIKSNPFLLGILRYEPNKERSLQYADLLKVDFLVQSKLNF